MLQWNSAQLRNVFMQCLECYFLISAEWFVLEVSSYSGHGYSEGEMPWLQICICRLVKRLEFGTRPSHVPGPVGHPSQSVVKMLLWKPGWLWEWEEMCISNFSFKENINEQADSGVRVGENWTKVTVGSGFWASSVGDRVWQSNAECGSARLGIASCISYCK